MNLENKIVLITGSSKGIGAECARAFAKNKANVIINYNNSEYEALKLEKELKNKYNIEVLTIKADLASEIEIVNMIEQVILKFGKIDILVNNAGIAIDTIFEDKTKVNFMKTLEVNLVGTFLVSKYAIRHMLREKQGKIINISSTNGIDTNYVESLDYDASKAGVISLTHNLAKYGSPYINVNCICPGWVDTDMNKELSTDFKQNEENKILLKRFACPEEIANLVTFLSSPSASYINDAIIRIDGGLAND